MTSHQKHTTKQLKQLNWTSKISGISLSLSDMLSMTSHSHTGQDTPPAVSTIPMRITDLEVEMCSMTSGVREQARQNPNGYFA